MSVASTAAVRVSLQTQYYSQLSQTASDAGVAYAKACLAANNDVPLWTDTNPLTPYTDCSGQQTLGFTCLTGQILSSDDRCSVSVNNNAKTQATFTVKRPALDSNGKATDINATGAIKVLRSSDNSIWRQYNQENISKVTTSPTVSVLVVGGGGGGGYHHGGGGGGGGVIYNSQYAITPQAYTVTVGNGGSPNGNGQNSSIIASGATPYGSSSTYPGKSCYSLMLDGIQTDGVYWIDPDGAGANTPFQAYCDMTYQGGGWTMVMKATRGNTFGYNANYWTTANTLNPTDISRNDADAKYRSFNEMPLTDIMARWPDAGDMRWYRPSTWNNVTALTGFNTYANWGSPTGQLYWNGTYFSTETGIMQHGTKLADLGGSGSGARWGSRYNNEADWGSDDVSNGIGMIVGWSAGDYVGCCAVTTGMNRTARVEMYGRSVSDTSDNSSALIAIGGGAGGSPYNGFFGSTGGSSGGAGNWSWGVSSIINSPGQGNVGASNNGVTNYGGGGGGAGGVGGGTSPAKNNGGDGKLIYIGGVSTYYGGGGGAGTYPGYTNESYSGVGGLGGGGTGGNGPHGSGQYGGNGTVNTGGGGGGTADMYKTGGSGGSGVVIISYPTGSMTATGGTITMVGFNTVHTFYSSGVFTVLPSISSAKVLVVAGGGGGGFDSGGGGAAGGIVYSDSYGVTTQSYPVVVGSGGSAAVVLGTQAASGGNSSFGTLVALGGGGGGSKQANGANGGSGGGSGHDGSNTRQGGLSTTGQLGNNGGTNYINAGSGGGGAGAVGGNASNNTGGAGGNGVSVYSSLLLAANAGVDISGTRWVGGGGGGGSYSGTGGIGGNGGGGQGGGSTANNQTTGVANSGGGGGGQGEASTGTAKAGGSGIVIISYPTGAITATGGTITTSGGYTIHKFTSSGTFTVTPTSAAPIKALVVAGGGSGGYDRGGGGGAGGLVYNSSFSVSKQSYSVIVGSGGVNGGSGQNSSIKPVAPVVYGMSAVSPGKSCYSLLLDGNYTDGIYWIDPDGAGANTPFQVYCDMTYNGGGWTMLMKAAQGTTFNYDANYWTTNNVLNDSDVNRNNADSKFRSFNELSITDIMARWPDAGDIRWLHNNAWTSRTALTGFNEYRNWGNHNISPYWNATYFSAQAVQGPPPGPSAWGTKLGDLGGSVNGARWGYRFNENGPGDWGSDDVGGGIGIRNAGRLYSAGDWYSCCGTTGMNRAARVEVYGRNLSDAPDSSSYLVAIGGGAGNSIVVNGLGGGSGGGAGANGNTQKTLAGYGVIGQGNNGGDSYLNVDNPRSSGGGGGAGGAGINGTVRPDGGIGLANSISGASVMYAAGGGGGDAGIDRTSYGKGLGGSSIGGNGGGKTSSDKNGTAGAVNTGSGGGGAGNDNTGGVPGSGGSGIVIISYPTGSITATGGMITTSDGNTIHTFTSSGIFTVL